MSTFVTVRHRREIVGFIFVLLDGIFGVFTNRQFADRWNQRLLRNEEKYHVVRKKPEVDAVSNPTDDNPTEFAGLLFAQDKLKPSKAIGMLEQDPTNRQVAAFCGRMLWATRITNLRASVLIQATPNVLLSAGPLLTMWSATIKDANMRSWDEQSQLPRMQLTQLQRLAERWEPNGAPKWTALNAEPLCSICVRRAKFGASDATPTGLGWLILSNGSVQHNGARTINRIDQVVAEARALLGLARAVVNLRDSGPCYSCGSPQLLIAAIDADAVRFAVRKGYSSSPELRPILQALFGLPIAIYAVRVAGKDNAADDPSRHRNVKQEALEATWKACQEGLAEVSRLA